MIVWFLSPNTAMCAAPWCWPTLASWLSGHPVAVLPGCGPIYAFAPQWLNPPQVQADTIRLAAMPNAFPSLHLGTAFVFVFFAPGRFWRAVSLAFLCGTGTSHALDRRALRH